MATNHRKIVEAQNKQKAKARAELLAEATGDDLKANAKANLAKLQKSTKVAVKS